MVRPIMAMSLIVTYIILIVCSQNLVFEENQTAVLSCSVNVQGLDNGYILWYSPTIQTPACTCSVFDNSVYCQSDNTNLQANYTNIQPTKSLLTIQNVSIQDTGKWRCVLRADNQNDKEKGAYDLFVIARPQEIYCQANFSDNNSQLQILCKTVRIYPYAVCDFSKINSQLNNSLVVYNHTADNKGYFESTCYVKVPLLQLTPGPLNFSIELYPNGSNSTYGLNRETNIELDYPDPVLIDCPSPKENFNQNYIKYGSSTTCTCRTNRTGNPPATTNWINSSNSSVLHINTTSTNSSYNCTVVSVFEPQVAVKSISYKPIIAYGPFNVSLFFKSPVYKETLNICNKQPLNISVSCMSTEANPPDISFTITVNGSSETNVTSIKEFSKNISVAIPGPLDILCTATNRIFESLYSISRTSISVQKPPELAPVIMVNDLPTKTSEINVQENENVTVSCEIIGGIPNIANITISCGLNSTQTIGNIAFLALGKISKERQKQKCECMAHHVTGCYNNNFTYIFFNVLYKATITTFSATHVYANSTEIANGTLVTFKCEVDGNPRPNVTIRDKRKQYQTDSNGTASAVMTCSDGGLFFCNASNPFLSEEIAYSNTTLYVFCQLQFGDPFKSNATYIVNEGSEFFDNFTIFGYPAPTYFIIKKINYTTKLYDNVQFEENNVNNLEPQMNVSFSYNELPFGTIIISIKNLTISDFTKYVLYISNNMTNEPLKYFFEVKKATAVIQLNQLNLAIVEGCVITAGCLSLVLIVLGLIVKINSHKNKGQKYQDNKTDKLFQTIDYEHQNGDIYFIKSQGAELKQHYKNFSDVTTTITTATALPMNLKLLLPEKNPHNYSNCTDFGSEFVIQGQDKESLINEGKKNFAYSYSQQNDDDLYANT